MKRTPPDPRRPAGAGRARPGAPPPGRRGSFAGMAPQGPTGERDFALMESSERAQRQAADVLGRRSSRTPLRLRARLRRLRPRRPPRRRTRHPRHALPLGLAGVGDGGRSIDLPVATSWQRWAWATFLRDAVNRYGPLWVLLGRTPRPALPADPHLGDLERAEHRHLLELDRPGPLRAGCCAPGRVLHEIDPGARVLLGGLFGRPLQIPPNTGSGDWLSAPLRGAAT